MNEETEMGVKELNLFVKRQLLALDGKNVSLSNIRKAEAAKGFVNSLVAIASAEIAYSKARGTDCPKIPTLDR